MPHPLYIVWSKDGIAPQCKNNAGLKIATTTCAVLIICLINLAPTGVNATSGTIPRVEVVEPLKETEDYIGIEDAGHDRHRRAAVTPLGKRLTTKLVQELGTRPRHLYSFGIGK